jgi:hypothetical protein
LATALSSFWAARSSAAKNFRGTEASESHPLFRGFDCPGEQKIRTMKSEKEIFLEVINTLEHLNIPYMIGGSVAAIAYGEPRLTLDMDVIVKINAEQAKKLSNSFGQEYYVSLDSILDALASHGHFNIIQSEAGVKVDFYVLQDDPFSQSEFSRKCREAFDQTKEAVFVSAEDVILKKLEWFKLGQSQKHLEDIKGILKISGTKLDCQYINEWASKLGVQETWNRLKQNE